MERRPDNVQSLRGGGCWLAEAVVVPKEGVNDPEGEAILGGLRSLGHDSVHRITAGQHIAITLAAADAASARAAVEVMCEQLLANPVIETYRITVRPLAAEGALGVERAS